MRVLVLVVDGLRPDCLGPYGHEWIGTPTLDRWAVSGVVFDNHFADGPDPAAFERGLRTGRHPLVPAGGGSELFADLQAAGVRVARLSPPERDPKEPLALKPTRRAVRKAIEQLGDAQNALLWVEIDALLPPWQPSEDVLAEVFVDEPDDDETDEGSEGEPEDSEPLEPWTGPLPEGIAADDDHSFARLQYTYAAAVMSFDAGLGRLLDDCTKRGWGDETLWVLTSGRGFPLGEHEVVGYTAARLHTELTHLPLLVRWPNAEHAGMRVTALTQPVDLAPTVRELLGVEIGERNDSLAGKSWAALARGEDHVVRQYALTGQQNGDRFSWGMRSRDWYLLLHDGFAGARRLYAKPDDRWEVNDVYQH